MMKNIICLLSPMEYLNVFQKKKPLNDEVLNTAHYFMNTLYTIIHHSPHINITKTNPQCIPNMYFAV